MEDKRNAPLEVFCSYVTEDAALEKELEKHLVYLKHQGLIVTWASHQLVPGATFASEIDDRLKTADVILLLISSDFVSSEYHYNTEIKRALEKHKANEACVIPVLLRPTQFAEEPFAALEAVPKNGKAVTLWKNRDEAWVAVVQGIHDAVIKWLSNKDKDREKKPEVPVPLSVRSRANNPTHTLFPRNQIFLTARKTACWIMIAISAVILFFLVSSSLSLGNFSLLQKASTSASDTLNDYCQTLLQGYWQGETWISSAHHFIASTRLTAVVDGSSSPKSPVETYTSCQVQADSRDHIVCSPSREIYVVAIMYSNAGPYYREFFVQRVSSGWLITDEAGVGGLEGRKYPTQIDCEDNNIVPDNTSAA